MAPQVGQAGFRLAFFIIFVAGCLLFVTPPGSAEFYITLLTLFIGVAFVGLILLMLRIFR